MRLCPAATTTAGTPTMAVATAAMAATTHAAAATALTAAAAAMAAVTAAQLLTAAVAATVPAAVAVTDLTGALRAATPAPPVADPTTAAELSCDLRALVAAAGSAVVAGCAGKGGEDGLMGVLLFSRSSWWCRSLVASCMTFGVLCRPHVCLAVLMYLVAILYVAC
jgi:hypothetical protein